MVTEKKKIHIKPSLVRGKYADTWIYLAMIGLMIAGFLISGSANMSQTSGMGLVVVYVKQFVFMILGYFAMCTFARNFKISQLKSEGFMAVIFGIFLLLIACLFFSDTRGSRAWIAIPGIGVTIQPSEFAKIVIILVVALYCGDFKKKKNSTHKFMLLPIAITVLFTIIIVIGQSDLGSGMVLFMIAAVCFLIPEINDKGFHLFQIGLHISFWLLVVIVILALTPNGISFIQNLSIASYQKYRFLSAADPFIDRYNTGYNLSRGLIAYASGGLTGVGYGNSVVKFMRFPACTNDFISAVMFEELGFIGFLLVMSLYGIVIFRLLSYAFKIKNEKAKIIVTGTAMYFIFHIFLNIGGATGLIPLTGIPLLMLSTGGSSVLSIMTCVGISQAVISQYRRGEIQ